MNVLVACEERQRVCISFRERGYNAFSCDIKPFQRLSLICLPHRTYTGRKGVHYVRYPFCYFAEW